MMRRVLVVGAAGYIGRYCALEFKNRGYIVRAFVRDPEKLKHPGPSFEPAINDFVDEVFTGDATRPETLAGLCDGVDLVFSSMGLTRNDPKLTFEEVDHLANRNILDKAVNAGVRKFVYVSVFRAELMMESDVVVAHEHFVDDLRRSGLEYAIVRPNAYFSDMGQFLKLARSGHMFWLGDGTPKINPIHGADMATVCVDAAEGSIREIDAGGPDMFTLRTLFELAFEAVGKKPNITFIPLWIGEVALTVIRLFSQELAAKASFFVLVNKMDNDAPPRGSRHLADFYRELTEPGSGIRQ
jgi:uncharacterized protein YbjT (DUF2867 family)